MINLQLIVIAQDSDLFRQADTPGLNGGNSVVIIETRAFRWKWQYAIEGFKV